LHSCLDIIDVLVEVTHLVLLKWGNWLAVKYVKRLARKVVSSVSRGMLDPTHLNSVLLNWWPLYHGCVWVYIDRVDIDVGDNEVLFHLQHSGSTRSIWLGSASWSSHDSKGCSDNRCFVTYHPDCHL